MKKYIKMPNGARLKQGDGRLKCFIAQQLSSAQIPQHTYDFAARQSDFENMSGQTDYATEDFKMAKLNGFPVLQDVFLFFVKN